MAIIKCKMCGGDLQINAGMTVAECEYCGSKQTIPTVDNEKKLTLFSRANRLRFGCEFDKAAGIYEALVADFPQEAEAYWGLVLCKYGIEYVDDPATGRKIPTCHRSSFDSVMDDSNLEQALENADAVARKLYREEAKQIEELRKGIIEVSGKEAPYDIFICYKETAEDGNRTIDSVIAQDVYDALTAKGYRVFFSRITLEDKLGQEYEPYIFAALNSAKIMLAFGTDYEYFNAVWVKNEWSRYLQLMTKDKSRHLIPCYKGIDAYDMPKEFAKLQAQDMGKVGAIQDLLRGIEKLLPRKEKAPVVQQVVSASGANVQALIDRGNMALEDGEWQKAGQFFDRALDANAQCAEAYLGKALVDFQVPSLDALAQKLDASHVYLEAEVRQAGIPNEKVNNQIVETCLMPPYLDEKAIRQALNFSFDYWSRADAWAPVKHSTLNKLNKNRNLTRAVQYAPTDMKQRIEAAYGAIQRSFEQQEALSRQNDQTAAAEVMHRYQEFLKEARPVKELYAAAKAARKADYENALSLFRDGKYQIAKVYFEKTAQSDYQDSLEMLENCSQKIAQQDAEKKAEEARRAAEEKAEAERKEALRRKQETARKKKNKATAILTAVVIVAAITIFMVVTRVIIPGSQYKAAKELLANGQYEEAATAFEALGNYKDSPQQLIHTNEEKQDADARAAYDKACALLENGDYDAAIETFFELEGYRNSQEMICEAKYRIAQDLFTSGMYEAAGAAWEELGTYNDSPERKDAANRMQLEELILKKQYADAQALAEILPESNLAHYAIALGCVAAEDYEAAYNQIDLLSDNADVSDTVKEFIYNYALDNAVSTEEGSAPDNFCHALFLSLGDYSDAKDRLDEFAYRIIEERTPSAYFAYSYDENAVVLRNQNNHNIPPEGYAFDKIGRIISISTGNVHEDYSYNADGTLKTRKKGLRLFTYTYQKDSEGRIVTCVGTTDAPEKSYDIRLTYTFTFYYNDDGVLSGYDETNNYSGTGNAFEFSNEVIYGYIYAPNAEHKDANLQMDINMLLTEA